MKNLYAIFSIFLFLNFNVFSQISAYQFPKTFPSFYNFHPDEAFQSLNKKPLTGLTEEQSGFFRMATIYELQKSIDQNDIYLDWLFMEDYLYRVFDTLIPQSYRAKHPFKIFIGRDAVLNAHANDNGFLFINIGLLASVRNEAQLVSTVGHETGHAFYDHSFNKYSDYVLFRQNHPGEGWNISLASNYVSRNYELIADTFGFSKMALAGYDLHEVRKEFDIYEREFNRNVHTILSSYSSSNETRVRNYFKAYSTHPMNEDRVITAENYAKKTQKPSKKYLVDSLLFNKIRKIAQEESKKILFESADFKKCLELSFIDYLYNSKNFKNTYFLIESLRRFLYAHPEYKSKGFLTEEYSDKEFVNSNYSILKKPELLFLDSIQESELINHALFKMEKKPFNSYEEALFYFCDTTSRQGFNEANFTLALYNFAQKNETEAMKNLEKYITNNVGLNIEFAKMLSDKKKIVLPGKKMLLLFDNTGMYSENNAWNGYNYFQEKSKIPLNKELKPILYLDSSKTKLFFLNELLGKFPAELNQYQKIEQNILALYTSKDKELYRKKRVHSREMPEEMTLSHKYTKNFLISNPEYYKWFLDNDIESVCFANISYDFDGTLSTTEIKNDYTTYYLNFNMLRPYIKSGVRGVSTKKQSTPEIAKDIADFLYNKE